MCEPKPISIEEVNKLIEDPIHGRSEITQLELDLLYHIDELQKENKKLNNLYLS
jgi:hypothetical protein